jgi:hypothetical protein
MLKFEDGRIEPGYVSFTETTLLQLDHIAENRNPGAQETLWRIGHNCGKLIMANTDAEQAVGVMRSLRENMNEWLLPPFDYGYLTGIAVESEEGKRRLTSQDQLKDSDIKEILDALSHNLSKSQK